MLYSLIIKHEINWKVNMYGEARSNIDILYQIVCKYCTINLLHILIIQILHYQPIKNYTIKINPHTGESRLQYLKNFIPNTFVDDDF